MHLSSRRGRLVLGAALVYIGGLASACSAPKPSAPPPPAAPVMKPVVSVKEFMRYTIDPLADNIFDAVTWDITRKGTIATQPKSDEDWEKVRVGAITLAESVYLLKVPRAFTPEGDVNNSTGPNPPELSPTQIKAKLDKDPVLWDAKIEALRNVAMEVFAVANKKDVTALFEASEDLDRACEACHLEYWYPGDRAAVDDDARQKARFDKSLIKKKK